MSPPVFRAVMRTALLCAIAGYVIVSRNERRHQREMAMTGIPPAGHADLGTALEEWEQDALDGIAARWDDAGLEILGSEGETA